LHFNKLQHFIGMPCFSTSLAMGLIACISPLMRYQWTLEVLHNALSHQLALQIAWGDELFIDPQASLQIAWRKLECRSNKMYAPPTCTSDTTHGCFTTGGGGSNFYWSTSKLAPSNQITRVN
jgi:hypothetical protein